MEKKKDFISYLDDNNEKTDAFVEVIQKTDAFVEFSTNVNILTIPWQRVLKLKQVINNE